MLSNAYKLFLNFKIALYSITRKLSYTEIITVKLKGVTTQLPTYFLNEALHFQVVLLQLVPRHLSLWWAFMTCCVNKATPIIFINGKCYIKQLKAGKTRSTSHIWSISRHWLLIPRGQTHTQTCGKYARIIRE